MRLQAIADKGKHFYAVLPDFLIRIPAFPIEKYPSRYFQNGDPQVNQPCEGVPGAVRDPIFRTAISVASHGLYSEIRDLENCERLKPRTISKLLRYLIRMSTRPTPFGSFAAVGMGAWGARTTTTIQPKIQTSTRVDVGWLHSFHKMRMIGNLGGGDLVMAVNPLIVRYGGRFYLLEPIGFAREESAQKPSIRATVATEAVISLSKNPLPWRELRCRLMEHLGLPTDYTHKVDQLIEELEKSGFLLTHILPNASASKPEADTLEWLNTIPDRTADLGELQSIHARLREWDHAGGEGRDAEYHQLRQRALLLAPSQNSAPFQTDASISLESFTLSSLVADDIVTAAELLLQLSRAPQGPRYLQEYRERFLARYGENRLVPVLEVLQDDAGLGSPNFDESRSRDRASIDTEDRDGVLAELIAEAAESRSLQVELTDVLLARLRNASSSNQWPETLELFIQVSAQSAQDIDGGNFKIVVGPNVGSLAAGKALGRFADLLGSRGVELLRKCIPARKGIQGPIHAELSYQPSTARLMNVMLRPILTPFEIPVGLKPSVSAERVIALDDLLLGVDDGHFYLYSSSRARRVQVHASHMLNPSAAPAVVRFLSDVSQDAVTQLMGIDWGASKQATFLPRIAHGRIILSVARWKLTLSQLRLDTQPAAGEFFLRLQSWRERYSVPRFVFLAELDNRLLLDLEQHDHVDILRVELSSRAGERMRVILEEGLPSPEDGWLKSRDGSYLSEFVVPLVRLPRHVASPALPPVRREYNCGALQCALEPPGRNWIFLKLYCSRHVEDDLLCDEILRCVRDLQEKFPGTEFFFVRYADPDRHLRLRWSGKQATLWKDIFPRLCAWSQTLLHDKLCSRVCFDTYEPEVARYGGADGLRLAERIACTDSPIILNLIAGLKSGKGYPGEKLLIATATIEALLANLLVDARDRETLIEARLGGDDESGHRYRSFRAELDPVCAYMSKTVVDDLPPWMGILKKYEPLRRLGTELKERSHSGRLSVGLDDFYASVLHLHCNRLFGLDRKMENRAILLWGRTFEAASVRKNRSRVEA